jgi:hypothetical protein
MMLTQSRRPAPSSLVNNQSDGQLDFPRAEERLGQIASDKPSSLHINRGEALRHLEETDRHIAVGREHIARQREIINELDREGHDTSAAKQLLETFLETQAAHEDNRRMLLEELSE